ncbi:hypothetical protein Pcinc_035214 [Petrolisthes cinctipes]|uniref:Uncharacterized protein n=1 Tax=Petrolisthes cinctipes TaxID=88211 RepID=A0AAE1BWZ3_PETCI|nr:hypothetical protein Pcinc_035214 [Petrolisthes cinctipes]
MTSSLTSDFKLSGLGDLICMHVSSIPVQSLSKSLVRRSGGRSGCKYGGREFFGATVYVDSLIPPTTPTIIHLQPNANSQTDKQRWTIVSEEIKTSRLNLGKRSDPGLTCLPINK